MKASVLVALALCVAAVAAQGTWYTYDEQVGRGGGCDLESLAIGIFCGCAMISAVVQGPFVVSGARWKALMSQYQVSQE